jgi:hypothetical protein
VVRRVRRGDVDSCQSYTLCVATGDGFSMSGLFAVSVPLSEPGALGTRTVPPASGNGIIFQSAISSWVTVVLGNSVIASRSWFVVDEIIN